MIYMYIHIIFTNQILMYICQRDITSQIRLLIGRVKSTHIMLGIVMKDISIQDRTYITVNGLDQTWLFSDYMNDYIDSFSLDRTFSINKKDNFFGRVYIFSVLIYDK